MRDDDEEPDRDHLMRPDVVVVALSRAPRITALLTSRSKRRDVHWMGSEGAALNRFKPWTAVRAEEAVR